MPFERVTFPSAGDSVTITGWWFAGAPDAPAVVACPRGRGSMSDLLPAVVEFAKRGFAVLTFDYRDFGPGGPGEQDSLKHVVLASRWVDDAEGALRFVRAKVESRPVLVWGQDLGSAVGIASAARETGLAQAVAVEGMFRTTVQQLEYAGLAQIPGAADRQRRLVRGLDQPVSAIVRLSVPVLIVLAQKDDVTPAMSTLEVARRNLMRVERWTIPDAGHDGAERTPGYFDHVAEWFRRVVPSTKP